MLLLGKTMKNNLKSILLFFLITISFSIIDKVTIKSSTVTTNYMNVMQDQHFTFVLDSGNAATINISDKIIIYMHGSSGSGVADVVEGSSYLDSYSFSKESTTYQLSIRLKWQNNFVHGQGYVVSIKDDAGGVTTNVITYNESFVVQTFNITSDVDYMYVTENAHWFKGGISSAEGAKCSGIVRYQYPDGPDYVYPLKDVSTKLYFDNVYEGSVVSVLTDGSFEFNNFTFPVSTSGVSDNVELKVDVEFPLGDAFLNIANYTNTKNLKIDNEVPQQGSALLELIPDNWNNDNLTDVNGIRIEPEIGWYNQLTVSVKIKDQQGLSDNSGSGLKSQFLYEASDETKQDNPSNTVSIKTIEGVNRVINVYVLDNVNNRLTMSVVVSVDLTPPGIFYLTIDDDDDNSGSQMKPQTGWYNDETVSISWTQPSDVALRSKPYQVRSDVGWPTWSAQEGAVMLLNQFQADTRTSLLNTEEGGSTLRTVIVRAVDKAGNIRKVEEQLYVDITAPVLNYLNLLADTTYEEGHRIPESDWYNKGSEVRWMWSVSDGGVLPNQPYAYRNLQGTKNITGITTNVNDAIVDTSQAPTGNEFELKIWDMAGNVTIVTDEVFVDETEPSFNYVGIEFIADNSDNLSDGVIPNTGWFDQTTISLRLTWDIDHTSEEQQWELSRLYVKTVQDISYTMHSASEPTFSEYTVIPQDNTPIIFTALFVNKAGWTKYVNDSIKADVTTPSNLNILLQPDADSGGDDIAPMSGWYDDNTIDLTWEQPIDAGKLRDTPYRIKINDNAWDSWQSEQYKYNLVVSNNTKNIIYIQAADEAGNVITNSIQLTVDMIAPTGSFTLQLEDDTTPPVNGGITPDAGSGWYNDNNVRVSFISENITNTSDLRSFRYFVKNNTSKTAYGAGFNISQNVLIFTTDGGDLTHYVMGAIADRAGNVVQDTTYVMVDMKKPYSFPARVLDDTSDNDLNGIIPSANWYDDEQINLEWDETEDDGRIHLYPYRLRGDTTTNWTAWQDEYTYTGLEVLETAIITHNIYIQKRDRAGNILTKTVTVKIDKTPPEFLTFNVVSQTAIIDSDIPAGIQLPLDGWFNQEVVTLSWTIPSENAQLRPFPYREKASTGQVTYSDFHNNLTANVRVSANNHNDTTIYLYAIDEAGNSTVVTRTVKIDIVAPVLTINFGITRNYISPYVITGDLISLTLQVSEALSIDPIFKYINVSSTNVSASVSLIRNQLDWFATFNITSLIDGIYRFYPIVFDNAGNKTTTNYGDTHFIVSTHAPPSANNFKAWTELFEYDDEQTQVNSLQITFNVDDRVKSYWVTEESGQKPVDNEGSFLTHPTSTYQYMLKSEGGKFVDGMKTLYLWVKDEEQYSSMAVQYQIYFDHTTPSIKIKPAGGQSSVPGEDYDNVIVASTEVKAILEVWNQSQDKLSGYYGDFEPARVTPFWQVFLPAEGYMITVNLNPKLSESAADPDNEMYRREWYATYNAGLAQVNGGGYFVVGVTDNAFNFTEHIYAGGTFTVNIDAATNPDIFLYSLDGRTEYTRWLTINVVISKDSEFAVYDEFKIIDGSYTKPGAAEFSENWPPSTTRLTVNFRIDSEVDVSVANEDVKDVYVWTKKNPTYINPGIVMKSITYDATIPTFTIRSDVYRYPMDQSAPESVRTTLFVNERLDNNPTPMVYIQDEGGTTLLEFGFDYYQFKDGSYEYLTTLDIVEEHKNKYLILNIIATDLAGNTMDRKIAFRQQLVVKKYKSEVNPNYKYVKKGETDYAFMSCVVSSNDQPVHLKGIKIMVGGHYIPSDVSMVSIYSDGDDNGLFEPRRKYDLLMGIAEQDLDASGVLYIPFDEEELIVSSSSKRFFVVADIGDGAIAENTLRLQFATENAFKVGDDEIVNYDAVDVSLNSDLVEIIDIESTIIVNNLEDVGINPTVNQGENYELLKKLKLFTDVGTSIWRGLQVLVRGDMDTALFTNISVFKDVDYNGLFDEEVDQLISSGLDSFEAGRTTKDIMFVLNQALTPESDVDTYFLVAGIDIQMPLDTTFNFSIVTPSSVFVESHNVVIDNIFPVDTIEFNVDRYMSRVNLFYNNNDQEDIFQGDRLVLQKMLFTVDYYNPEITNIAFALEGGAVRNDFEINGQTEISLYRLNSNIAYDNDYFYLEYTSQDTSEKIPANVSWENNDSLVRLTFTPDQIVLSTENEFALVVSINPDSQYDRDFRFVTYMLKQTDNMYVVIQNGIAKEDKTVTSNTVTIIHRQQPSKPEISANYFTSQVQRYNATYFSYTKSNEDIVKTEYAIGSVPGGKDKTDNLWVEADISNPSDWIFYTDTVNIRNIILDDNTTYYLSLQLKSEISSNNYRTSKVSVFEFHTDFSWPHLPNYMPDIIVGEYEDIHTHEKYIDHHISWGDFVEVESGIEKYVVEEKSNYSGEWFFLTENLIVDYQNIKSSDREVYLSLVNGYERNYDMSYTYRIKAVNLAGLESEYVYTDSVSTVKTEKVLSNVSNYPNPFYSRTETTKIFYFLREDSGIEITIYDSMGHYVRKFNYTKGIAGKSSKGDCEIEWNGKNEAGEFVEKGGYFVVIEAPEAEGDSKKIVRMVGVIH